MQIIWNLYIVKDHIREGQDTALLYISGPSIIKKVFYYQLINSQKLNTEVEKFHFTCSTSKNQQQDISQYSCRLFLGL